MAMTFCLDCDGEINVGDQFAVGQQLKCLRCGLRQEIINVDPLTLDWTYEGPTINLGLFDDSWSVKPTSNDPAHQ